MANLVPVTVIAGYLGAGKTTLINGLLAGGHGRRLAVLVNDFGAISIDAALIATHDGNTISLTNGCVCCSLADALGGALDHVLRLDPPPEHIVVEASGVSDPVNVAAYGHGWPGCRLDTVIVLADAETIRARSSDQFVGELVMRQLRGADVIVITKCDLVGETKVATVIDWVREQTPGTTIVAHRLGHVDPALLLESGSTPDALPMPDSAVGLTLARELESVAILVDDPLERALVEAALRSWPESILRVKGIVRFRGESDQPHVVQRVGRRWTIEAAPDSIDPSHVGQLVVVGQPGAFDNVDVRQFLRTPEVGV